MIVNQLNNKLKVTLISRSSHVEHVERQIDTIYMYNGNDGNKTDSNHVKCNNVKLTHTQCVLIAIVAKK